LFLSISLSPSVSVSFKLVLAPWCNDTHELIDCLTTGNWMTAHTNTKNIPTIARHVTCATQAHTRTHTLVHTHTHMRFHMVRGRLHIRHSSSQVISLAYLRSLSLGLCALPLLLANRTPGTPGKLPHLAIVAATTLPPPQPQSTAEPNQSSARARGGALSIRTIRT